MSYHLQKITYRRIDAPAGGWSAFGDEAPAAAPAKPVSLRKPRVRTERENVYRRATEVIDSSKTAVVQLFGQARMGQALDQSLIAPVVDNIQASIAESKTALLSLTRIRRKDEFTYVHSIATCALMISLGRELGLAETAMKELGTAGLLHDVGKMLIPESILMKPGRLTADEMTTMRSHSEEGHRLLMEAGNVPQVAMNVALHHHEKVDGSGYPFGLEGEDIPYEARMGAICDVYDAMSAERPYKEAWTPSECLKSMFSWHGHFDKTMLAAFIKCVGIYPVGSLVQLESGFLALVVEQPEDDLSRPLLRAFYDTNRRTKVKPFELDLAHCDERITSREDPKDWGFADWDKRWPKMMR